MTLRLAIAAFAAALTLAPVSAGAMTVEPTGRIELSKMMGRWYEVARVPNQLQDGCQAGASDWTPQPNGFAVVQSCRKDSPTGPLKTWKAKATVSDPRTNAKLKISFFGGVVSQNYVVVEHRPDETWQERQPLGKAPAPGAVERGGHVRGHRPVHRDQVFEALADAPRGVAGAPVELPVVQRAERGTGVCGHGGQFGAHAGGRQPREVGGHGVRIAVIVVRYATCSYASSMSSRRGTSVASSFAL